MEKTRVTVVFANYLIFIRIPILFINTYLLYYTREPQTLYIKVMDFKRPDTTHNKRY